MYKSESRQLSRKNKQTKIQNKTKNTKIVIFALPVGSMCIVYFLRDQSFFIALGVGWRILGEHMARGGKRIICRQKGIKRGL